MVFLGFRITFFGVHRIRITVFGVFTGGPPFGENTVSQSPTVFGLTPQAPVPSRYLTLTWYLLSMICTVSVFWR